MNTPRPLNDRLLNWLSPIVYLSSNAISLIGVVLVTIGAVSWLFLLPIWIRGTAQNGYLGLLWMAMLSVFILGLIMIPVGIHFRRLKLLKKGAVPEQAFPMLTLQSPELRRLLAFILATTVANAIIAGQLTYAAVSYMDTDQFCGTTCHTVMQPEYKAYLQSAHNHVSCVECHIGPGAGWFVKSKISGSWQLIAVTTHSYPTPIPSPVSSLRPAHDTCEHCHSPLRFNSGKTIVHTEFAEDEHNTPSTNVLSMKVGGRAWNGTVGIHGTHMAEGTTIEYISTDTKRQDIAQVIYRTADGKETIFNATDKKVTPEQLAKGERRTADCVDCHNRPTHVFQLPGRALDDAMSTDHISPALPFVKKQALEALKVNYPDRETGMRQIGVTLDTFYKDKYPQIYAQQKRQISDAIKAVQAIYDRNIFPEMKVTWGTYINNLGHNDTAGCFRCHDGNHTSAQGRTIPNDCTTCHDMVAMDEKDPKVLDKLGIVVPGQAALPATKTPAAGAKH